MTLLELMIVVAIVGILAAVAIPAYNGYVTRSRRSDAFTALETVRAAQEMYRAEKGEYAAAWNRLAGCDANMAGANYNLVLAAADSDGNGTMDQYTIDAQRRAQQANDHDFQIDQNGNKFYDGNPVNSWEDIPRD
jgi:prepilin-type N-terminal cleavage/methylation domain-containing protein